MGFSIFYDGIVSHTWFYAVIKETPPRLLIGPPSDIWSAARPEGLGTPNQFHFDCFLIEIVKGSTD